MDRAIERKRTPALPLHNQPHRHHRHHRHRNRANRGPTHPPTWVAVAVSCVVSVWKSRRSCAPRGSLLYWSLSFIVVYCGGCERSIEEGRGWLIVVVGGVEIEGGKTTRGWLVGWLWERGDRNIVIIQHTPTHIFLHIYSHITHRSWSSAALACACAVAASSARCILRTLSFSISVDRNEISCFFGGWCLVGGGSEGWARGHTCVCVADS